MRDVMGFLLFFGLRHEVMLDCVAGEMGENFARV